MQPSYDDYIVTNLGNLKVMTSTATDHESAVRNVVALIGSEGTATYIVWCVGAQVARRFSVAQRTTHDISAIS